uniref:Dystroglycan-type cadherin-like domain-containing protein n=1 Tax=Kwoniella bestiolae CBS 10118 TaxID=1296100 RepID=A0A1B9FUJ4_9TREE|nr:hypothetical protein I302_08085 [Kwoniella bestiolae CBS 10118]OCF22437.1 hypothetical protein I302_08085 [Kwoniella bestiolae CBS 10118]
MLVLPSLLALAASIISTWAVPTLNFPLDEQQPSVARVNQEFVFELLPATFNSTSSSNLTYTTSTLPSWLSWDSPSLAFHGTPAEEDEGEQDIVLTATDGSGSTESTFTLIVSNYSVPAVHQSFYTQISRPNLHAIASASIMPGGTGVTIPPYWSFSLGFQTDTFRISRNEPNNGQLYYAAHTRGNIGLPSWLIFNNESFTFTGVAPAEGSFTVVATGTDFWGYTGAQTSFTIEIGQGEAIEMARNQNLTNAQTMAKNQLNQEIDLSGVTIGGNAVDNEDVVLTLGSNDYPWLSIDSSNDSLVGTVPDQYQNGTFASLSVPVNIRSTNTSNTLYMTTWLGIDILPYFFSAYSFPNSTATLGQAFNFDITSYLLNKTATVNATVNPSEAANWLKFDTKNMSLYGTPPSSLDYNKVDVIFQATIGQMIATSTLNVNIPQVSQTSTHTGTAAVPTSSSGSPSSGQGISKGAKIAMGVCLGLLLLVTIALILFFCCCRRRKNKKPARKDDDNDSFVATSPVTVQDPFRRSNSLDPPRNLLGEIARFSGLNLRSSDGNEKNMPLSPASLSTDATMVQERPTRLDGLKGIFGWNTKEELENEKPAIISPQIPSDSRSFIGYPDVIGVNDPVNRPSQDASSFTQSFISESSRASWQSQESFRWSSVDDGEGEDEVASLGAVGGNRISTASSIPRPRPNFTPRYPRHQNPSVLARMVDLDDTASHASFSEFHSSQEGHHRDSSQSGSNFDSSGFDGSSNSMMASGSMFNSQSGSGSSFPAGPSGLSRFGESQGFKSNDTDDEDAFSVEGPAVVAMAERQSFETRRPQRQDSRSHPRLKESRSRHGTGELVSGMFSDADDHARRSTIYAPSEGGGDNPGLGYPASAIYFGSQNGEVETEGYTSQRTSTDPTKRGSTIKSIPGRNGPTPLSPALPQVGSFIRHRRTNTGSAGATNAMMRPTSTHAGANDGRITAVANETFSIHPQINPPPTVSLSAATWSSNPPSTYRAEVEGGGNLPTWLHFDSRELELWGVPPLRITGDVTTIRIIERLPRDNRRSDPMSFGYEPPQEREVGRVTIEVSDRMRSPQFALEGSPHAL